MRVGVWGRLRIYESTVLTARGINKHEPSMPTIHSAADFLTLRRESALPLFDVRSPLEFAAGHIPGALNLPLFSDDERAAVGTAHAKAGREAAVHVALEHIGPQLAGKLSRARHFTGKGREVLMHCWRGGLRSGTMAWLLEAGGYTVHLLTGGYKAYRTHIREVLGRDASVFVLGGMTGSGKTDILHELAALGEQVIDLEGLANHRGSAFGGVGLPEQPSNEWMENQLHEQWAALDFSRPIWLEDENRQIGRVTLPDPVCAHIARGRLVLVEAPFEARVERLARIYTDEAGADAATLLESLDRIRKRLGDEAWRNCVEAVRGGRYADAVRLVLGYYDKAYVHLLARAKRPVAFHLPPEMAEPAQAARRLAAFARDVSTN